MVRAVKELSEMITDEGLQAHEDMTEKVDFTEDGMTAEKVRTFFDQLVSWKGAKEPTVQSGGIYGVSETFHDINGPLLLHQIRCSSMFAALSKADQTRADSIFETVFLNRELRNRNPLHPSVIDSSVVGNVLNFPKHLFGFPYGCYASDGNESLSLVLYSYREKHQIKSKCSNSTVVYLHTPEEVHSDTTELEHCALRLNIKFQAVSSISELELIRNVAVVVIDLDAGEFLNETASWAVSADIPLHIHVTDSQLRSVFVENPSPVHFNLPQAVTSLSLQEGMLCNGYSLYRDFRLRDYHLDVPVDWQTVYLSPNEGGSCTGRPLFMDLCMFLLGWRSMRDIARNSAVASREEYRMHTVLLPAHTTSPSIEPQSSKEVIDWASKEMISCALSRDDLETDLVSFQQEFFGGHSRVLETTTTGGGTRSINLAFETVIAMAKKHGAAFPIKVLTGNPHLAVERAERRFQFELIRIANDGIIDLESLKRHVKDPRVIAVYAQTLSFTDGISDPLEDILEILEVENASRNGMPVVLINDSCLAFNVLVHQERMRLLDISKNHVTPVIVMNDAHKHLGTDKGLSTVIGTRGTVSHLNHSIKVGMQPTREDLLRAIADLRLVGKDSYYDLYHRLNDEIAQFVIKVEHAGMKVIHGHNRYKGSTVVSVEDPSGHMIRKLKKKGYSVSQMYSICPGQPNRCQTGWQLSITPHHLRIVNERGQTALEVFVEDLIHEFKTLQADSKFKLAQTLFRENSLMGYILSGNVAPYIFSLLSLNGTSSQLFAQTTVRRYCTAQIDSGTLRISGKQNAAIPQVLEKAFKIFLAVLIAWLVKRKMANK